MLGVISSANLLAAAALLLIWSFGTAVYYISYHPLAKYPGPLLAKLTAWYEFSYVSGGGHHFWLYRMHQRYGPVVRVAPNRLSYNSTEAIHDIYSDRKANVQKAGFTEALALLKGGDRNLQTMNDRHAYTVRRRLVTHVFTDEALRSSEEYILRGIREWCQTLGSKAENPKSWTTDLDMNMWANLLTEDILGDLCFGEQFGVVAKGHSDAGQLIEDGCVQAQALAWMPFPPAFYRVLGNVVDYGRRHNWKAMAAQLGYDKMIDDMIEKRMAASNSPRKDFFYYVSQAKDIETGEKVSPGVLCVEAGVLFGAGVDTSATVIAACVFYLIKNPDVYAKVTSEIRTRFSNVEQITNDNHAATETLPYLAACIEETLRVLPPVPGPLLREVMKGGITVNGEYLPPGTQISVAPYVLHHNEKYFPDSFTFKPERWLPGSLAAEKDAFCTFSIGLRSCPGRKLAYLDVTLALARLLFLFDVRQVPGSKVGEEDIGTQTLSAARKEERIQYAQRDWFITGRKGPMIQLRARG